MSDLAYNVVQLFAKFVTNTFFRDIEVIGLENIPQVYDNFKPKNAPLILYGNHNNQFLDPLIANVEYREQKGKIYWRCHRINIAKLQKSMRRPIIGHIGRATGTIPVERPQVQYQSLSSFLQDLAVNGKGQIIQIKNKKFLIGVNTKFSSETKVGDGIIIQGISNEFYITSIISDTELEFKSEESEENQSFFKTYKIQPKVDQSQMFASVWSALSNNDCVGIFPEGGSHDRSELLPLKAGICIMALGAMQKYKKPIYLQPVGLSYFKGHRFRSKVFIEFGIPKCITEETLAIYQKDKREAISMLLKDLEKYLQDVTVFAPTYSNLSALYLIRQIYLPDHKQISPKDGLEVIRRVARILKELGDHPEVQKIKYEVKLYQQKLKHLGLRDQQIKTLDRKPLFDLIMFIYSLVMSIASFVFVLPGLIMNVPIAIILNFMSEKERKKVIDMSKLQALAKSRVKIHGKDIIASYKVLLAMVIVPISVAIYTLLFYYLIKNMPFAQDGKALKYSILFIFLWPIYVTIMIRSSDGLVRHSRTVKAKFVFYLLGNHYIKLRKQRDQLQLQVREFVQKVEDKILGPLERRIISEEDFTYKTLNQKLEEVFECLQDLGC